MPKSRPAYTLLTGALILSVLAGCGNPKLEPVELYPEDMCSLCRMAISDERCAAEMIMQSGEVVKFDDIGCLRRYQAANPALEVAATFVKNYEDRTWLAYERAVIVETDIITPMASGLIAFADSTRARVVLSAVPAQ